MFRHNSSHSPSAFNFSLQSINEPVDSFMFALTLLLSLTICTMNGLTILLISRTASLKILANIYVVSLAVVDFLVGLALIPVSLFMLSTTRVNLFYRNVQMCVFINGFNVGMTGNSLFHMAIIAVDRYLYIVKPYVYVRRVGVRSVIASLAVSWTLALVYTIIPFAVYSNEGSACYCDATGLLPRWYLFYSTWLGYFLPASIILVMYALVLRTALSQRKRISAEVRSSLPGDPHSTKTAFRSIRFFVTVSGAFFICITPMVLCMGLDYIVHIPAWLYRCLIVLALLNSGMNFVILTSQNRQFRGELLKLLCQSCRGVVIQPSS